MPTEIHENFRLKIDTICKVPIFVTPVADSLVTKKWDAHGPTIHLQVVNEAGSLFHVSDLEKMCLNRQDLKCILDLCERRPLLLCRTFLTGGNSACTRFHRKYWHIDGQGLIHISFILHEEKEPILEGDPRA